MKSQIHIALAEDHDIVREGLISLLQGHSVIKVLFDVSNGKDLLEKLKTNKPDIILLDLDMPIMSGREALDKIKQKYPKIKVIIISATFSEPIIIDFVKKGVNSFLPKNCKIDKLIEAIIAVQDQGVYFDNQVSKMLAKEVIAPKSSEDKITFTEIELNILRLTSQGQTSKEVAEQLFINHRTVEWHRSQMMRKIKADNFAAVIAYAVQNKLVFIS